MGKMVSHPGKNTSVKVTAHERKRPARNARGPADGLGQLVSDQLADNAFLGLRDTTDSPSAIVGGLEGCPPVNHLKAAIGLMSRKRV
jgi:hypothetical protein